MSRLVLSVALLALGVIALLDVAGAPITVSVYFSVSLAVIGAGLVLGAWHGHGRGLIAVGVLLSVGLAITASAETWSLTGQDRNVTWRPTSVQQLAGTYEIGIGSGVLDLSGVDFSGRSESIDVRVSVGDLHIIVPPNVDVEVQANVDVGNATVFGQSWGGINRSQRTRHRQRGRRPGRRRPEHKGHCGCG